MGYIIKRYYWKKCTRLQQRNHDDVMKWKYFPRCWTFVWGIHRSPVNSPHKGQWRWALMFPLLCAGMNGWVNNREAGDLRRHRAHYDVKVMQSVSNLLPSDNLFNGCNTICIAMFCNMFLIHCIHRQVSMVVAHDLVPIWCQAICKHLWWRGLVLHVGTLYHWLLNLTI